MVLSVGNLVNYVTQYTTKLRTLLLTFNAFRILITLQGAPLIKNLLIHGKKIHHSDRSQ